MDKTMKPREVVEALTKAIKETLQKHVDDTKNTAQVVTVADPVDPVKNDGYLSGQEPTNLDAVEHHASLSAAQFHAGHEELSKAHRELAVAHAGLIGVDAEAFLNAVYSQFEGMSVPEEFIPHGKDAELEKNDWYPGRTNTDKIKSLFDGKRKTVYVTGDHFNILNHINGLHEHAASKGYSLHSHQQTPGRIQGNPIHHMTFVKGSAPVTKSEELEKKAPSFEAFDDASGEGVDKRHAGPTPDDKKSKLINDPQKDKVKKEEESTSSESVEKADADGSSSLSGFAACEKPVEKAEVSEFISRSNRELLAHQLGLFKAEPIMGGANSPLGSGQLEQKVDRSGKAIPSVPAPTPTPSLKAEESTSTSEEEVEKAGEFKSKQVQSIRQAKGYTRARPQAKEELSSDQQLDGKGKPSGDPKSAVLHKDK